jgi:hypothetical protein
MFARIFITLASFTTVFGLYAQDTNFNKGNLQWFQYYFSFQTRSNWSFLADGGFRWEDTFSQKSQFITRAGLQYSFGRSMHFAGGLAVLGFYDKNGIEKYEVRPYQEWGLKHAIRKVNISHRIRLEERFFESNDLEGSSVPSTFNIRFRYQIFSEYPLYQSKSSDFALSANIGNEVMLHSGEGAAYNVFDQNRLMLGMGILKRFDI